jgi:hypothetical protein
LARISRRNSTSSNSNQQVSSIASSLDARQTQG